MATPQPHFEKDLVIPQEVLELVAENLGHDEVTLSSFALASRTFLLACRVHRFRYLTFANLSAEDRLHAYEKCLALRNLMTEAPDLIGHTRCLTLVLERPLGNDPNLPWIIQQIHSLSSLRLLSGSVERVIDWDSFSPELQDAIYALFRRSPTLSNLVIESYESVSIELIRGATSLKHISFHNTFWSPDPSASPTFASDSLAHPISLKIAGRSGNHWQGRRTEMYMEPPKRLFSLEVLVELEVVWTERMGRQFEKTFRPSLPSLQILGVEFTTSFQESLTIPVNLSPLLSLRVLKMAVNFSQLLAVFRVTLHGGQAATTCDEFTTMLASLRTIDTSSSRLESFYLKATTDDNVDTMPWRDLDYIIARLNSACAMQTVAIDFHCPPTFISNPGQAGAAIRSQLPLTDALGILAIQTPFD